MRDIIYGWLRKADAGLAGVRAVARELWDLPLDDKAALWIGLCIFPATLAAAPALAVAFVNLSYRAARFSLGGAF